MGKEINLGLTSKSMKDTCYKISVDTLREAVKLIDKDTIAVCFFKT